MGHVAVWQGHWLALLGWQSGAFKCAPRDRALDGAILNNIALAIVFHHGFHHVPEANLHFMMRRRAAIRSGPPTTTPPLFEPVRGVQRGSLLAYNHRTPRHYANLPTIHLRHFDPWQ